jgi:hypothetical protein
MEAIRYNENDVEKLSKSSHEGNAHQSKQPIVTLTPPKRRLQVLNFGRQQRSVCQFPNLKERTEEVEVE